MKKKYPEPFAVSGSPFFYFWVTEGGRRRKISTGEKGKERARGAIRSYIDSQAVASSRLSFSEYAAPFFLSKTCPHYARLRAEGKSIGLEHLSHCRVLLEHHLLKDAQFASRPIAEIKRRDLLDLRKRLQARGLGENTINKILATAKVILSEASFREDIEGNPGAEVGDIHYQRRERGVLAAAEVSAILDFLGRRTLRMRAEAVGARPVKPGALSARATGIAFQAMRDEALVSFLFASGARMGELEALRWRAVDFKTGRVSITEAVKGKDGIGLPKWNKTREIVLARLALDRLKEWKACLVEATSSEPAPDLFVFGDMEGHPLGYEGAHNVFETIIKEARREKVLPEDDGRWLSPHSARHSLNTNLLAAGVAPLLVQSYLGWTSAEAKILTRVQAGYTHLQLLRVEDVAKAVDEMYTPKSNIVIISQTS